MIDSIPVGAQLRPGGTPDYRTWREAVLRAEDLGADAIFGYDHFHKPFAEPSDDGWPVSCADQPDVNNFEGWTALASWAEITTDVEIGLLVTGDRIPQSRSARRHGPHRRPHQRGPTDPRPGRGLVRKGLREIRIRLRNGRVRMDLFDEGLHADREPVGAARTRRRLSKIPILIGGTGAARGAARSSPGTPTSGTPSPAWASIGARTRS